MDMDVLGLLREDHRRLEELLGTLERSAGDAGRRGVLAGQVHAALRDHVDQEEGLLYPAVRARPDGPKVDGEVLGRGAEQHRRLSVLAEELAGLAAGDDRFVAKLGVLAEQVRVHLDEENTRLFTAAEDVLGDDELLDLGRRLEERKRVVSAQQELRDEMAGVAPPPSGRDRRLLRAAVAAAAAAMLALLVTRRGPRRRSARPGGSARRRRRSR
jgi:hemerythrin-like domain-containing protein